MHVSFTRYEKLFPGFLTEEQFLAVRPEAESMLYAMTGGRIQEAEGYKAQQAEAALCTLCNILSHRRQERVLESVTNDGYTERYRYTDEKEDICRAMLRCLSGTGLVSVL